MQYKLLFILLIISVNSNADVSGYSGFIGDKSVTFIIDADYSYAYYLYNKYDTPIELDTHSHELYKNKAKNDTGNYKGYMNLHEKNNNEQVVADLVFKGFSRKKDKIIGEWISRNSTKRFKIQLKKEFDIEYGKNMETPNINFLAPYSTKDHYFILLVEKTKDSFFSELIGVNVFEKGTDKLVYKVRLYVEFRGPFSLSTGDYNNDGLDDFLVVEQVVSGMNVPSFHFIREADSDQYHFENHYSDNAKPISRACGERCTFVAF